MRKNLYKKRNFILLFIFPLISNLSFAASRYWVGSGSWTSSNTANWSATSGGVGGQSVPTSADDVFFSASSGTCSILVNGDIKSLTLTGGTLTFGGTSGQYSFRIRGNYSNTSGTASFNASNATSFDVDGNFTHSINTFTAPSTRNMYIGGNWTRTAGVFTHSNGTVIFDGNNAVINSNLENFYHLTINKTSLQILTITSGQVINSLGILNLTNGKAAGGTIAASNNVVVGSLWDGGSTKLLFTGSATTQTFNLTGAESLFQGNLEINKSAGAVSLSSNLTMNFASQAIDLTLGNLNLNSKILTLLNNTTPSGTLITTGTFTITGPGTFNMYNYSQTGNGTVTLAAGAIFHVYNNFDQATTPTANFMSGTANMIIDGDLNLSEGFFYATTGTLSLGGDLNHTGGDYVHNSGTVEFIGNSSILVDPNCRTLHSVIMNKNSGQTLSIATGSSMSVANIFRLNQGNIVTTAWTQLTLNCAVDIQMTGSPNNCSSASYVDGPLSRKLCSSGSLFYPIGRNGNYRPLTLTTVVSATTNFTAEQIESNIPTWCLPSDLCKVSKIRHFKVTMNTGIVYKDPIALTYCTDDGVSNASDLRVAQQVGTCWKNIGGTGTGTPTGTITSTVDFTTYGDFILASKNCLNALPVKLVTFKSSQKKEHILLNWITASEINNDRFEVQRSLDGQHWSDIGIVKGYGNSNTVRLYEFEDVNLPSTPKVIYYRLKQVDFNGEFEYSPMVVEAFPGLTGSNVLAGKENDFNIYPNPAKGWITVENLNLKKLENRFEITDLTGKKYFGDNFTDSKIIELNFLAPGLYIFNFYDLKNILVKREKIIVR